MQQMVRGGGFAKLVSRIFSRVALRSVKAPMGKMNCFNRIHEALRCSVFGFEIVEVNQFRAWAF